MLGFAVRDGALRVGPVTVRCDGRGGGLRGWTLAGAGPADVDGIPTRWAPHPPPVAPGERGLDHVVALTDSRDRTAAALVAAGGDERRRMDPPGVPAPLAFVRCGVIVEVAQAGGPPRLWGLTAVVEDLAELPPGLVGEPRPAVQPGRMIATVRPEAGLGTALAFMTPRPAR